jgi:hypothetical protein
MQEIRNILIFIQTEFLTRLNNTELALEAEQQRSDYLEQQNAMASVLECMGILSPLLAKIDDYEG